MTPALRQALEDLNSMVERLDAAILRRMERDREDLALRQAALDKVDQTIAALEETLSQQDPAMPQEDEEPEDYGPGHRRRGEEQE